MNTSKLTHNLLFAGLFVAIASCGKGSGGGDNGGGGSTLPAASISDVTKERSTAGSTYTFNVALSKAATAEVSINYTTVAATAAENTDFTPTSGTVKIPANSASASITVQVKGDSTRKENQYFNVMLSSPVNCSIQDDKGIGEIVNINGLYLTVDNKGYDAPSSYPGYSLVWADEFSEKAINTSNWSFEAGNNNGWGNAELEYYTDRPQNAFVSNGNLIIEARKEALQGALYTSARMITKNKRKFTYGRVDIRAKTPTTRGIWPALWMLGNNIDAVSWPACGEIDIMEQLGHESSKNYGTLHWGPNTAGHQSSSGNVSLTAGYDKEFHVYSVIWKVDRVQFLVDNTQFHEVLFSQIGGTNPFTLDQFFIFNVAVGGNWPGAPDATTVFPQRMFVDYIRVYQ